MVKTNMEKKVCAKVWDLSNPDKKSTFSKSMFMIAMHLMYKKRQNPNLDLPDQVPIELRLSAQDSQPAGQNGPGGINVGSMNSNSGSNANLQMPAPSPPQNNKPSSPANSNRLSTVSAGSNNI